MNNEQTFMMDWTLANRAKAFNGLISVFWIVTPSLTVYIPNLV